MLIAGLSFAGSVCPAVARAEPAPRIRLLYERGAGAARCADVQSFVGELVARLGRDPFVAAGEAADELVQVSLTGAASDLTAHLLLQDPEGRELGGRDLASHSTDCGELERALVLEVAMAIDPEAALPKSPPPAAVAPTPPPRPEVPSPVKPLRWQASVGVVGSAGAAPAPALGFSLGAETRWQSASLGLEGRVDLPAQTTNSDGTVQAELIYAQVVPCYRYKVLGVCGLLAAGVEQGSAVNLTSTKGTVTEPYVAVGARAFGELPLYGPLSARLQGDLVAPLAKTALKIGDEDTVWLTPPVSGALAALLVVRFL